MDDDFDLPDEGGNASGSSFVNELFSNRPKRQTGLTNENRSTLDDILASSSKQRPRVTFQDEQQPSHSERENNTPAQTVSSSLLDSLFSGGSTSGEQRRSTRAAGATSSAASPSSAPIRGPSPSRPQSVDQRLGPPNRSAPTPQSQESQQVNVSATIQAELEQLRREVSSLRYEHSEDQQTINEVRRKLEAEQTEHKRDSEKIREENKLEMQELIRRNEREKEEARREADRSAQLLNSIREQQGHFDSMVARLEGLNFGLGQVRDLVQNVNESNDKMAKEWNEQQAEHWKRLDEERGRLENSIKTMEKEMDQMRDSYQKAYI
uniref:TACC_C domain-containing protein n=1 Tax=Meloidogyne hapla TaxID=6305 RepID=A0A1I8BS36_MELHA